MLEKVRIQTGETIKSLVTRSTALGFLIVLALMMMTALTAGGRFGVAELREVGYWGMWGTVSVWLLMAVGFGTIDLYFYVQEKRRDAVVIERAPVKEMVPEKQAARQRQPRQRR